MSEPPTKLEVKINLPRVLRAVSRELFGRPGVGRKTCFTDRKKEAARTRCRGKVEE